MSTPHDLHDRHHDDLLHAHLAGDLPQDDPVLAARLAGCAPCRERLVELRSLTNLLEQVGGAQRRSLAPLAGGRPSPGSERVASTLAALAAGRAPSAPRPSPAPPAPTRRATLWRVSLAAASVLAAGWIVKTLLPPERDARDDVLLGHGQDRSVTPHGSVVSFDEFDWSACPEDASYVRVRVWLKDQAVTEEPVAQARVDALPWIPTASERAAMQRSIRWEVLAYDALGGVLDSARGEAELGATRSN